MNLQCTRILLDAHFITIIITMELDINVISTNNIVNTLTLKSKNINKIINYSIKNDPLNIRVI